LSYIRIVAPGVIEPPTCPFSAGRSTI